MALFALLLFSLKSCWAFVISVPDASKQMSSRFSCNLKTENSKISYNKTISLIFVSFSIDISALFIILVKLERKPFL